MISYTHRVQIDDCVYKIASESDLHLTQTQSNLAGLLLEAAKRDIQLSKAGLVHQLGLKSSLPLDSRLKHLQEAGAIYPLLIWKDCPICTLSGIVSPRCACCEGTGRIAIAPHSNCKDCDRPIPLGDRWCKEHQKPKE